MTPARRSIDRSDEPIAHEDEDPFRRLSGIADFFLVHDRPIHTRCYDSVVRVVDGATLPLRRARGFAPLPLGLPRYVGLAVIVVMVIFEIPAFIRYMNIERM